MIFTLVTLVPGFVAKKPKYLAPEFPWTVRGPELARALVLVPDHHVHPRAAEVAQARLDLADEPGRDAASAMAFGRCDMVDPATTPVPPLSPFLFDAIALILQPSYCQVKVR